MTSLSTIVQDILYLVISIYKLPRMLLILHSRDLNFLKYGHEKFMHINNFYQLKIAYIYIVCILLLYLDPMFKRAQ